MSKRFWVIILSYKRADKVFTYTTLRNNGYTWDIYFVCSTDDPTIPDYRRNYWDDKVFVFDKSEVKTDLWDNFSWRWTVVFARNKVRDIAKEIWLDYFIELDDDYRQFSIRYIKKNSLKSLTIRKLDDIFQIFVDFMHNTPKADCIALWQWWDYIWWARNRFFLDWYVSIKRKIMNAYINRVSTPYYFYGRMNEDTTCYTQNWKIWKVFLTHPKISVVQPMTQTNSWWLTEMYLEQWTYQKTFYSLIWNPSSIKVSIMWRKNDRIHHNVVRRNAVPVIMREAHKKKWKPKA